MNIMTENILLSFLQSSKQIFQSGCSSKSLTPVPTVVLGNSSCDLDSFISSVTLAYFYSKAKRGHCLPLLNLPNVKSSDLWRFRPEFGTALSWAIHSHEVNQDEKKQLLNKLTTVADLQAERDDLGSTLRNAFAIHNSVQETEKLNVILTDHNVPSIPELSPETLKSRLEVIGCIDHHDDESYVKKDANPRIIQTGIGSCTSLVVEHLRQQKLWPEASDNDNDNNELAQLARLALAPILIDTTNLKATGDKNSPTDREAVKFLESHVPSKDWNRDDFYKSISSAKTHAIELLTIPEVFERDYKEWSEIPTSASSSDNTTPIKIGISSLTAPLVWLVDKTKNYEKALDDIQSFIDKQELSIFAILSIFNDAKGDTKKEDLIIAVDEPATRALAHFQQEGAKELGLEEWDDDEEFLRALDNRYGGEGKAFNVWWQRDVSMSRKQVAPLLREAVKSL